LPADPYTYAEWHICRVGLDYHVELNGHWYSVPHRLIREKVEVRITGRTIEIFHRGQRIASHACSEQRGDHTTIADHMPDAHRRYAGWNHAKLLQQAANIGPFTLALVERLLHARPHPEQGFRSGLGILNLARSYDAERIEAACRRGMEIGASSYTSVRSILRNNLDRALRPEPLPDTPPVQHGNIRGGNYYH
jgi:transposase